MQITVLSGSTLGNAEDVAEALSEKLTEHGFTVHVLHGPVLEEVPLSGLWLIVTSTHGAGDLPENLSTFYEQIQTQQPDLSAVRYGAIGLGDRSYDTFCNAIVKLDHALRERGAQRIGEILKIDVSSILLPEDPARAWLDQWLTLCTP